MTSETTSSPFTTSVRVGGVDYSYCISNLGKLDNFIVASFGGCADWSLSMIVPYLGIIQYPIYIYVLAIAEVGLEPTTC